MYETNDTINPQTPDPITRIAQRASEKASEAVSATKGAVYDTADAVGDGLRDGSTSALKRAAAQADVLSRRGIDKARRASVAVRDQARVKGDQTVAYIREEPVKAVLMAAAAGALLTMVLGRRRPRDDRY